MTKKRSYRMNERARSQEETRQKIVEATMHLHEEIGPRATTISAIAERAGVQRLTVYRHFPDETAVFQACTSHWLELNPPPDPAAWADVGDGRERARAALAAFYGYYAGTERMWTTAHRDFAEVPALQGPMGEYRSYLRAIADDLVVSLGGTGAAGKDARLAATVSHALAFTTWASLKREGLSGDAMVETALAWIGALAGR